MGRNRKYGRKVRLCIFDNKPCERPPSSIDGDPQCGGAWFFGTFASNGKEEEIRPNCSRMVSEL